MRRSLPWSLIKQQLISNLPRVQQTQDYGTLGWCRRAGLDLFSVHGHRFSSIHSDNQPGDGSSEKNQKEAGEILGGRKSKSGGLSFVGPIEYYQTADEVTEWCNRVKDVWCFGFDGEWDRRRSREKEEGMDLLQFAYVASGRVRVALIHLAKVRQAAIENCEEDTTGVPLRLKGLLEEISTDEHLKPGVSVLESSKERGKHKAGCGISGDVARLCDSHGVVLRGMVDLDPGPAYRGIKKMISMLFHRKLQRDVSMSDSIWSGDLSHEQRVFAANNAFGAYLVFRSVRDGKNCRLWEFLDMYPDPIVAAMLRDDVRVFRIKGW